MVPDPAAEGEASILFRVEGSVGIITLNRPAVRNAIDDDMRADLVEAIDRVGRDDAIRALVLTGAGKAFCSGGDVKAMERRLEVPPGQIAFNGWKRQQRTHHAVGALHRLPKPTIAAVNGAAAGLGCDLALCCDFIVASESASLAMTYVLRGLIPDGGGMYFLPRRVGLSRAKQLIFSGRKVDPDEALAIGMIDRVVPADRLVTESIVWAAELAQAPPAALALSKTILNETFESGSEAVFGLGSQAQAICYSTEEHLGSVRDFLAKRGSRS